MTRGEQILETARQLAASCTAWADLSNALFDPRYGLVARGYPGREQREAFAQTPEYQALQVLLRQTMERTGLVAGATPTERP